jgi:hypothetical protein
LPFRVRTIAASRNGKPGADSVECNGGVGARIDARLMDSFPSLTVAPRFVMLEKWIVDP